MDEKSVEYYSSDDQIHILFLKELGLPVGKKVPIAMIEEFNSINNHK
jgi:hypothetical protein